MSDNVAQKKAVNRFRAEMLRQSIHKLGWTQKYAAARLDVSERTMRNWLDGKHVVPGASLLAMQYLVERHGTASTKSTDIRTNAA